MEPNADKTGVIFGVQQEVPKLSKGNTAQKREYDKKIGGGTMSRSGVTCPCCGTIMTMEDLRREGIAGRVGLVMTAIVVDTENGKEYRSPKDEDVVAASEAENRLSEIYATIPFGLPNESVPNGGGSGASRAFSSVHRILLMSIYKQAFGLPPFWNDL